MSVALSRVIVAGVELSTRSVSGSAADTTLDIRADIVRIYNTTLPVRRRMSHADPAIAIPGGLLIALGGAWVVIHPEAVPELGWKRTLLLVSNERATNAILRICSAFVAVVTAGLVVHETLALLGA